MTTFEAPPYSASMRFVKPILWFTVIVSGLQAWAHEPSDGDIYVGLAPTAIFPQFPRTGFRYPTLGAVTLMAEGDINSHGGVEIAMTYMPYISYVQVNGLVEIQKVQRMHITTGYRVWFSHHFAGYLGFFSAYAMGEPQTIENQFTTNVPDTSGIDSVEYGFDASLQYEIFQAARYSVFADVRYAQSVTPKANEDENFFMAMIGLRYFFQSREEALRGEDK